ncbi:LURP-one-related/scramblase family protein, partial [Bacillus subtilis]
GDSYHLQIANEEDVLICTAIAIVLDMVLYNDEDESIF